jgi:hypothetical protein
MKKLGLIVVAALLAVGLVAVAEMDNKDYNFTVVAANAYTNSYTLRGEIKAIEIDIAAGRTNAVVITSGALTVFSKTCTADARYPVLYPAYGATASALTSVGADSVTGTNTVYTGGVLAGPVTVVATGDAGETRTNALKVTVIYAK